MADVCPRKTLDLPSGEGRRSSAWGCTFTSGVLPTITEKTHADHAGGTLAALIDETRRPAAWPRPLPPSRTCSPAGTPARSWCTGVSTA